MNFTRHYVEEFLHELQDIEEISGPDSYEQYIAVLTAIRIEIDKRIVIASDSMLKEDVYE